MSMICPSQQMQQIEAKQRTSLRMVCTRRQMQVTNARLGLMQNWYLVGVQQDSSALETLGHASKVCGRVLSVPPQPQTTTRSDDMNLTSVATGHPWRNGPHGSAKHFISLSLWMSPIVVANGVSLCNIFCTLIRQTLFLKHGRFPSQKREEGRPSPAAIALYGRDGHTLSHA